jgi:hypothetical protein
MDAGLLKTERAEDILRETYAEAVILNWEVLQDGQWVQGIEGPNGDLLPFTKANVVQALAALGDLFNDIREQATSHALFRAEVREAEAGN